MADITSSTGEATGASTSIGISSALIGDARLLELVFLDRLERVPSRSIDPIDSDCPERRLIIHLLAEGFVNDASHVPFPSGAQIMGSGTNWFKHEIEQRQWEDIRRIKSGQSIQLSIAHRGAVRRAELEVALKANRIKEPFGIVWDGRHFRQDARIALLDASSDAPLAVAFLDLNDVKAFNEKSHATGDAAIKRYLEVITEVVGDRGDAYRLSGGADEVVVLLPRTKIEEALTTTKGLLIALARENVEGLSLRAAAGVVVGNDPDEPVEALKARADLVQARAKERSRLDASRPSFLAWGTSDCVMCP